MRSGSRGTHPRLSPVRLNMEISSKLTAEELDLKNKYKQLRRLKRSVDKLSSCRKRHLLFPNGDKSQVKVVSSEIASDQLKSHCVRLKAKTTSAVTEGFKKPGCWSRVDRRPAKSRDSRASERCVVRRGTSRMMDGFEEMYSRTDFLEEHQTVVFHYGDQQKDADNQHFENEEGDVQADPVNLDSAEGTEQMVLEDIDDQNDPLNQYVVEENVSPGNPQYATEEVQVDPMHEQYVVREIVATFQCTPDNSGLIVQYPVNPQRRCVVQRYGDVMQSNQGGDEDGNDNDEFTLSIVF
ncbi:hypothetical protein WDU94_013011 [Cyamophila willieti]